MFNILKNQNVLVTGAGGFIGSHLTEELVRLGANVRALVLYNSRSDEGMLRYFPKETYNKLEVIRGDITEQSTVNIAIKNIDYVFHLAASISIPYSLLHPGEVIRTNYLGTYNILEAARRNDIKKLVITSTSEVYGTAQYEPIDEKHPLQPQTPYAASKMAADKLAESYNKCYELPVTIIRPFNTFGPRQSERAVIPMFIIEALTKGTISIGHPESRKEFNYVPNTIDGFIKIMESKKSIGETINIGSGSDISIQELAKKITSILNKNINIKYDQRFSRPARSEVEILICDNSKAKEIIHWEPKISFEEGLTKTVEWVRNSLDFYIKKNFVI